MTSRERFKRVLTFQAPQGRLPMIEWAPWWNTTYQRWESEGLPGGMNTEQSLRYFGLDPLMGNR